MLCTNCGEKLKPVVAIDIDGTLGDYHGHFLAFAENYTNRTIDVDYTGAISFKGWCRSAFEIDERTWNDIKLAYRQGAQKRSMPVYAGAATFVAAVQDAGAEVWLTTTRPYLRLDGIDPDTRSWLDRQGITYAGLLYDTEKYARLAERVQEARVVAVLDDLAEQCHEAANAFGKNIPILRRNPYNKSVGWVGESAVDLWHAQELIETRIQTWKDEHGAS